MAIEPLASAWPTPWHSYAIQGAGLLGSCAKSHQNHQILKETGFPTN
jgi:hypothetical protein